MSTVSCATIAMAGPNNEEVSQQLSLQTLFMLTRDKLKLEIFLLNLKIFVRLSEYKYLVKNVSTIHIKIVTRADDGTETTTNTYGKHVNVFEAFVSDNPKRCH